MATKKSAKTTAKRPAPKRRSVSAPSSKRVAAPDRNTQRIGRCGELLVQYQLLCLGIESAPMTTDAGIDLVAFDARAHQACTIQVKTCKVPKPGGGKGKLALSWFIADDCPADVAAFVDLSTNSVWLFHMTEVPEVAQQHASGRYHLYMHVDPHANPRVTKAARMSDFEGHRLSWKAPYLFKQR